MASWREMTIAGVHHGWIPELGIVSIQTCARAECKRLRDSLARFHSIFLQPRGEANFFLIGLGVVWVVGIVDALIFGEDYERVEIQSEEAATGALLRF